MLRAFLRVLLGVALSIVALGSLAPAQWLDHPLATQSSGAIRMADAAGFWWNGSGVLASRDGRARVPVAWRVDFSALLHRALAVELVATDGRAMPAGGIEISRGAITLRDLHWRAPAATMAAFATPSTIAAPTTTALGVTAGGDVDLRAASFRWDGADGSGAFDIRWDRARLVAAGATIDLGDISAPFVPGDRRVAGKVRNRGGEVAIDGTVALGGGSIDVVLGIVPAADSAAQLAQVLPLLGTPDGNGAVRVTWHGAWRDPWQDAG